MEIVRMHVPFRRKIDENPYEALARLEKKLSHVQFDLQDWVTKPTVYGISVANKLEDNLGFLLKIKGELLAEINKRHESLVALLHQDA